MSGNNQDQIMFLPAIPGSTILKRFSLKDPYWKKQPLLFLFRYNLVRPTNYKNPSSKIQL